MTLIILGVKHGKRNRETVIAAKPRRRRKGEERERQRKRERERERERNVELYGGYAKADDRGYPRLLAELLLLNDYVT